MVAKDMKSAECVDCLFDDIDALLFVSQVTRQQNAALSEFFDSIFCPVCIFMFIQIADGDICPFFRKGNRGRCAYSAVSACNKSDFILQFPGTFIIWIFNDRSGNHFAFNARLTVLPLFWNRDSHLSIFEFTPLVRIPRILFIALFLVSHFFPPIKTSSLFYE